MRRTIIPLIGLAGSLFAIPAYADTWKMGAGMEWKAPVSEAQES